MKRFIVLTLLLTLFFVSFSQDVDLYQKNENDNFNLPQISWQMNYHEYSLLSKHFRMQQMLYAMVLPGYMHFYADEKTTGWILFTTRMMVYSTFLYTYYYAYEHRRESNVNQVLLSSNVLWTEAGIVMMNYFYDIIHGKYMLDKKQRLIRYKYSMKMQLSAVQSLDGKAYPTLGIKVNF